MAKAESAYRSIGLVLLVFVVCSCDSVSSGHHQNNDTKYSVAWKSNVHSVGILGPSPFGHTPKTTFIEGNSVYVLGSRPAKLDLKTGEVQWQMPLNINYTDLVNSSLLTKKAIVIAQRSKVRDIVKSNGQLRWKTKINLPPASNSPYNWYLPGADSSLISDSLFDPAIPDSLLYIQDQKSPKLLLAQTSSKIYAGGGNKLVGLNKTNGEKEIEIDLNELHQQDSSGTSYLTALASSPSLVFTVVETIPEDHSLLQSEEVLAAFDAASGKIVWSTPITDLLSIKTNRSFLYRITNLAYTNKQLYVLFSTKLIALNIHTGSIQWQTSLKNIGWQSNLFVAGDGLYTNSAVLGIISKMNTTYGSVNWKATYISDPIIKNGVGGASGIGHMVLANGRLYIPFIQSPATESKNGNSGIKVLDVHNGRILRTIKSSDVKGIKKSLGSDLLFAAGIAVQNQYLVTQGFTGTYCIKLNNQ